EGRKLQLVELEARVRVPGPFRIRIAEPARVRIFAWHSRRSTTVVAVFDIQRALWLARARRGQRRKEIIGCDAAAHPTFAANNAERITDLCAGTGERRV